MASMKVIYLGSLRTEGIHLKSGNKIITDAPLDNQGRGEAFSPTDLLCASLASCMFTVMGIMAERKKIDFSGSEASITKIMADNPRRVAEIEITMLIKGDHSPENKRLLEHTALTCPVALSLHPDIVQRIKFEYN